MRLRKAAAALAGSLVLMAITAGGAEAGWTIGGTELGAAAHESVTWMGGPGQMATSVLGSAVTITFTTSECDQTSCTLDGGSFGTDHGSGRLLYTGVTVDPPSLHCGAGTGGTTGQITSEPLTAQIIMDPGGGTATFERLAPASGTSFFTVTFSGASCPLAGVGVNFTGSLTARIQDTAVLQRAQACVLNSSEQKTGGGSLLAGKESATLTDTVKIELSGANAGAVWGVD